MLELIAPVLISLAITAALLAYRSKSKVVKESLKLTTYRGLLGGEIAYTILARNGLHSNHVAPNSPNVKNQAAHYDPKTKTLYMPLDIYSDNSYLSNSLAAFYAVEVLSKDKWINRRTLTTITVKTTQITAQASLLAYLLVSLFAPAVGAPFLASLSFLWGFLLTLQALNLYVSLLTAEEARIMLLQLGLALPHESPLLKETLSAIATNSLTAFLTPLSYLLSALTPNGFAKK